MTWDWVTLPVSNYGCSMPVLASLTYREREIFPVAAPQALIYMRHVCYHRARKLRFGLLHQHEPNLVRSVLSQLSP